MVTDRRDKSGHEKVFPIPGVNTRGYCSHLKPFSFSLSFSVRMRGNEKERVTPSENQGEERGSVEEGEEVTKTKDRGLARRERERER